MAVVDAMGVPVLLQAQIVSRPKASQLRENVPDEGGKGLGATQPAHGQLQVCTAPATLQRAPRRGKALTQQRGARRLPARFRPERGHKRLKTSRVGYFRCLG